MTPSEIPASEAAPVKNPDRIWAIGDIHGRLDLLETLYAVMQAEGFSLDAGHELVQLGDKNDRGPDSHGVMEFFRVLDMKYPEQIHCLWGNHELMMKDAAMLAPSAVDLFKMNGGNKTVESYGKATNCYGMRGLGNALLKSGHWGFLREHKLFLETEDAFFCHAPIPKYRTLNGREYGYEEYITNEEMVTWAPTAGYGTHTAAWVDPAPFKRSQLFVYGHVHDLKWDNATEKLIPSRVRRFGNAVLVDTGSGCHPDAPLSALDVYTMRAMNSAGEIYDVRPSEYLFAATA